MKPSLFFVITMSFQFAQALTEIKTVPTAGRIQFEAVGRPSMIKIKGEGEGASSSLQLNQNKISGEFLFKLESLKTGIDLRDEHMKEKYLQIKNNPVARLTFTNFQLPAGWTLQNAALTGAPFRAKLFLHGIEREIAGVFNIESAQLKSSAQFEIQLSDFKIDIPNYLGVKVADSVKINVSFDKMNLAQKN